MVFGPVPDHLSTRYTVPPMKMKTSSTPAEPKFEDRWPLVWTAARYKLTTVTVALVGVVLGHSFAVNGKVLEVA